MTTLQITHLQEPEVLRLGWIPPVKMGTKHRTWRHIANLYRGSSSEEPYLEYLNGSEDYRIALEMGFEGYPAFPLKQEVHRTGVLDSLLNRLPPNKRSDFKDYLQQFRLPADVSPSSFALLGYTGARLPSDGFAFYLPLETFPAPFECLFEVAGYRYECLAPQVDLRVGDSVSLESLSDHPNDPNAVQLNHALGKLGYVPRLYSSSLRHLNLNQASAFIERINGSSDRPLMRVLLKVQ